MTATWETVTDRKALQPGDYVRITRVQEGELQGPEGGPYTLVMPLTVGQIISTELLERRVDQ